MTLSPGVNALRALRRDHPERVPFEFTLSPFHVARFMEKTGTEDYISFFGFPIRYIELDPTAQHVDYRAFYDDLPTHAYPIHWNPEWGIMGIQGSVAHFQEMRHPMASFESVGDIDRYPFPDFDADYRWKSVPGQVKRIAGEGLASVAFMQMTLFEIAWYLRGMDAFMMDLLLHKPFAEALLERITTLREAMAARYAAAGVDILMLGDDIATQQDMMMSLSLWREIFRPRLARIIEAAKTAKPDILVFYHTDGNPERVIPDLIEIGVDILNPVQPECVDPASLKARYGNCLSFWGTLGTQSTFPFGSPEAVEKKCRERIETVGKGGGLFLAPTHVIEPDVPWENIEAFFEAVARYGRY